MKKALLGAPDKNKIKKNSLVHKLPIHEQDCLKIPKILIFVLLCKNLINVYFNFSFII